MKENVQPNSAQIKGQITNFGKLYKNGLQIKSKKLWYPVLTACEGCSSKPPPPSPPLKNPAHARVWYYVFIFLDQVGEYCSSYHVSSRLSRYLFYFFLAYSHESKVLLLHDLVYFL